jgi:chromosome segregation ATPase
MAQSMNINEENQVSELEQTHAELKRSQLQMAYLLEELEQFHSHNSRMQQELLVAQTQQQQAEAELTQAQSRLSQLETELQQVKSQLYQTKSEAERLNYLQHIATQVESEEELKYNTLVYEAWYAYQQKNLEQMVRYFRKSLRWSSFSHTKTVENWLESLTEFSQRSGENFDIRSLISSQQWRGLIQSMMRIYSHQAL